MRQLIDDRRPRPLVAAHRGDSCNHPENTLAAFRSAAAIGAAIQEFDVRGLRDGALVCVHDETFDRTTDAPRRFGPDRPVADYLLAEARSLDAGDGQSVATLTEALAVILPATVPLIEHKAGRAESYVRLLRDGRWIDRVVLQSFDWRFLEEVRQLAADVALGMLGPVPGLPTPDDTVIARAAELDVDLVHWHATDLGAAEVRRLHAAGLFVCTYTTDDEAGWFTGRSAGIDAMCTNAPRRMQQALAARRPE